MLPWLDARTYYRNRWGSDVGRIGVDGGFSCPNRGPNRSDPGCTFCSENANRPPYQAGAKNVPQQVQQAREFLTSRYGYEHFSLYFQAFSSTWAPVDRLRQLYDEALSCAPFVDLTVGTRPDCVPDEVADLLAGYQTPEREVWVELGLQSCHDSTLARVRRGHDVQAFRDAAARLRRRGLRFTAHILYGLPGEGTAEFLETVRYALAEGVSGLKFHDLMLVPGTPLHRDWQQGLISPVDPQAYLDAVAQAVVELPPQIVLWRVYSDPEDRKGPPLPGQRWSKNRFLNLLRDEVARRRDQTPATGVN